MNAVDTNVLVQYIVRDDAGQFAKAEAFLKGRTSDDPAFISLIVLVELTWVLRRLYRYSREQVHSVMVLMIETAGLSIEEEFFVSALVSHGAVLRDELADHLIAYSASKAGCTRTVTFDRTAAAGIPSMELLA